jgi:hypothetical protein
MIETRLTLNRRNISFLNQMKYIDVIICNIITWRLYTAVIKDNAFRAFITVNFLFWRKRLTTHIELTFHKAFIMPILSYACTCRASSADTQLLKLQRLQDRLLCTEGNFQRCTEVRKLLKSYGIPLYIRRIWAGKKQKACEVKEMQIFATEDKARTARKHKDLKPGFGLAYGRSSYWVYNIASVT